METEKKNKDYEIEVFEKALIIDDLSSDLKELLEKALKLLRKD
jgi:hypothetical protein